MLGERFLCIRFGLHIYIYISCIFKLNMTSAVMIYLYLNKKLHTMWFYLKNDTLIIVIMSETHNIQENRIKFIHYFFRSHDNYQNKKLYFIHNIIFTQLLQMLKFTWEINFSSSSISEENIIFLNIFCYRMFFHYIH